MFNDSENWRRMRRDETVPRGLVRGLFYVFSMALRAIPQTLTDFAREPARRRRSAAMRQDGVIPVHLLAFGADFDSGRTNGEGPEAGERGRPASVHGA
jgi:cellulose synthase (UDP-forming)